MKFSWENLLLMLQFPISRILEKDGIIYFPHKIFEILKLVNFFFQKFVFPCHPEVNFFSFEILKLLPTSKSWWIFKLPNFNQNYDFWVQIKICLKKWSCKTTSWILIWQLLRSFIFQKQKLGEKEVIQLPIFKFCSDTLFTLPKIIVCIEIGEYENLSRFRSW